MIKLAIIFGGQSTEHNISITSAKNIISNLNKRKYQIYPIYIKKDGTFYQYNSTSLNDTNEITTNLKPINNIFKYLEEIDIIFPVLHGLYGEDGTIQGMLELINKKYIGCKVLSSALCMNKNYTKIMAKTCNIDVSKSIYLTKIKNKYIYLDKYFNKIPLTKKNLQTKVKEYLKYPVFIKPASQGSSIGVNIAKNDKELIKFLNIAFQYDKKVLIEEAIVGREVECAILGNENPIASNVGEIITNNSFYSYEAKYQNPDSLTIIPANIPKNIQEEIRKKAITAYLACDCQGLARIDFFIEKDTNRIILNEINTMPGFTDISMYKKLMEDIGYSFPKLLDTIIKLANN